ncbi:MAG: AarF/ABC1/UbiB kinase family protein [Verrucomicrobiota bacterium]
MSRDHFETLLQPVRNLTRTAEIVRILVRFGFNDVVERLGLQKYLARATSPAGDGEPEAKLAPAARLRLCLEALGPTFIKLGQLLASRPDLLPPQYTHEFSKLQDKSPPFPFEQVEQIVESELGFPLESAFEMFDRTPLAAASIGQVHAARTLDGRDVVVKVQRPGITDSVNEDLAILKGLAGALEHRVEALRVQRFSQLIEDLSPLVRQELDYTGELANVERFAWQYHDQPEMKVPKPVRVLCTPKVLTMERVQGAKVSDETMLSRMKIDRPLAAARIFDLFAGQILDHGFFHADPHPGNIFVLEDNQVCFLDFGLMGWVGRKTRDRFANLLAAIAERDESHATKAMLSLTRIEGEPDRQRLENDVAYFMNAHFYRPASELRFGRVLQELFVSATKHQLRIPPDFFLVLKAFSTVENIVRELDPQIDIMAAARPHVERNLAARLDPQTLTRDLLDTGGEVFQLVRDLPQEIRTVLRLFRRGKVHVEIDHQGLEPVVKDLVRGINRLSYGLMFSAMLIGSALIVMADVPPKWGDVPIIGIGGFVLTFLMAVNLTWAIWRRGRL